MEKCEAVGMVRAIVGSYGGECGCVGSGNKKCLILDQTQYI